MDNSKLELGKGVWLDLQLVPAGEFLMGSPESKEGREDSESPQHRVKITREFRMSRYPVTQKQWQAVMGANPSKLMDPSNPVEMVSWFDAREFTTRLSQLAGRHCRLPTEAEWEYACRGRTTTRFSTGDTEPDLERVAWYAANSDEHPRPVGGKKPNAFGLYDMHGNVFEWVADWSGAYTKTDSVDPEGPPTGSERVLRGGCCLCPPQYCRSANRYAKSPEGKNYNIGFRVALDTADISPSGAGLAETAAIGNAAESSLMDPAVKELVAIGAAIASNCKMCFKYHVKKARELGVSSEDMWKAVQTAQMVKDSPARSIRQLASKYLRTSQTDTVSQESC